MHKLRPSALVTFYPVELRPAMNEDRAALIALAHRVGSADGLPAVGEHLIPDLDEADLGAGILAWEGAELLGAAVLVDLIDPGWWGLEVMLDPDHRGENLVAALVDRVLEGDSLESGKGVRAWAHLDLVASALTNRGFRQRRAVQQLSRSLPANPPEAVADVSWDPYREGDLSDLLGLHNRAFAGGGGAEGWTEVEMRRRMGLRWFRAEGLIICKLEGTPIGYCWTKRHSPAVGEIYVIAIDPGAAGRGLGRQLLRRGLEHLTGEGCDRAIVYVDDRNRRAIALYESEGFTLNRTERVFERATSA
jgi:mycothiol synthase